MAARSEWGRTERVGKTGSAFVEVEKVYVVSAANSIDECWSVIGVFSHRGFAEAMLKRQGFKLNPGSSLWAKDVKGTRYFAEVEEMVLDTGRVIGYNGK